MQHLPFLYFVVKEAGKAMDKVAQIAGVLMMLLMVFVAFSTSPPVGEAIVNTFNPEQISIFAIVTLSVELLVDILHLLVGIGY